MVFELLEQSVFSLFRWSNCDIILAHFTMGKDLGPGFNPETETVFNGVLMRDFVPSDREKLRAFYNAFASSDNGVESLELFFGFNPDLDVFESLIDPDNYRHSVSLLDSNDRLVGIGNYYYEIDPDPEHVLIGRLIIPEYQGRGIGGELVSHLIKRCKQLDSTVTEMTARTLPSNVRAINSLTKVQKAIGGFRGYRSDGWVDFNFVVK